VKLRIPALEKSAIFTRNGYGKEIIMKYLDVFSGFGVVLGWALMNASFITYALFWRIDNEPGVKGSAEMLAVAIGLACIGLLLFVGGNSVLLKLRAKNTLLLTWLLVIVITILSCLISPLWLVLMV
jgi:hypothetical protein